MTMSMWLVARAWRGLARGGLAHGRSGSLNELSVWKGRGWEQWPPPVPSLLPAAAAAAPLSVGDTQQEQSRSQA